VAPARHKHVLRAAGSRRQRLLRLGLSGAAVTVLASSAVAVSWPEEAPAQSSAAISMPTPEVSASAVPVRVAPISRSEERVRLEAKPPKVVGHKFATTAVNVRLKPSEEAPLAGALEWAEKVAVSGKTQGQWAEIVVDEKGLWVHSAFLANKKPKPEPEPEEEATEEAEEVVPTGLSTAPCASGSDVESGLAANAVAVHRAVCAAFPSITSYGGVRPGDSGEHGTGNALDVMISGDAGWEVAEYVRANAGDLGVSEVIYAQKIWTVERGSEGWRSMEDRGSTTANHYDHVHVSVY
jgi:hypothetical protein